MSVLSLANETVIQIVGYLDQQRDINSVCRVNYRFYTLFNDYLYRYNVHFRGSSALLWAAKHGNESTARKLLHWEAPVNVKFRKASPCPAQPVTSSINTEAQPGLTPLHMAVWKGHLTLVKLFLELRANPEARMSQGWTPLYLALISGRERIARTVSWHISNLHNCLVDSSKGLAPLHLASHFGLSKSVRFFLDRGADVNARDLRWNTPLHHALASDRQQLGYGLETYTAQSGSSVPTPDQILETVTVLLDFGAESSLEGFVSITATELGASHRDERVRKLFGGAGDVSLPKLPKPGCLHIGRSWMSSMSRVGGGENQMNNEPFHLDQHTCDSLKPRQVDQEKIVRKLMLSSYPTERRLDKLQFEVEAPDLSTFPVLGKTTAPKVSNSQMHLCDSAWSEPGTRILIAGFVTDDSESLPTSRHAAQADPFPQLMGHGSNRQLDCAASNLWATFRKQQDYPSTTDMSGNFESVAKASAPSRRAKARDKRRWQPLTL
jgi:hypothetical protein